MGKLTISTAIFNSYVKLPEVNVFSDVPFWMDIFSETKSLPLSDPSKKDHDLV